MTFSESLAESRREAALALFQRAWRANQLAKRLQGRNRRAAYKVKHRALSHLVRKGMATVADDPWRGRGLLSVRVADAGRLHSSEAWLGPSATG